MSVHHQTGHRVRRASARLFVAGALMSLLVLSAATAAEAFEWPEFATTEPVAKRFTLIRHYPYRERLYKPTLVVQPLEEPSPGHNSPEQAMTAQLSAMKALDFEWWLNTWEPESRERFVASGKPPEYWLQRWEQDFKDARFELVRFIETRRHVILTYRRTGIDGQDQEHTRVFAPVKGGWLATLALENSPGAKYFLPDASRERVVR